MLESCTCSLRRFRLVSRSRSSSSPRRRARATMTISRSSSSDRRPFRHGRRRSRPGGAGRVLAGHAEDRPSCPTRRQKPPRQRQDPRCRSARRARSWPERPQHGDGRPVGGSSPIRAMRVSRFSSTVKTAPPVSNQSAGEGALGDGPRVRRRRSRASRADLRSRWSMYPRREVESHSIAPAPSRSADVELLLHDLAVTDRQRYQDETSLIETQRRSSLR